MKMIDCSCLRIFFSLESQDYLCKKKKRVFPHQCVIFKGSLTSMAGACSNSCPLSQ